MTHLQGYLTALLLIIPLSAYQSAAIASSSGETADLVLTNAYVYTVDAKRTVAEAVAIRNNRIIKVGTQAEVSALIGKSTEVRDLGGRMVLPGLQDTHIHALGTVPRDVCDLTSTPRTLDELVPFLRACVSRYTREPGDWLIVQQWPYAIGNQPSTTHPTLRAALDAASMEHPIMLIGDDGHHGAANSRALALAKDDHGNTVGLNAATLQNQFAAWREHVAVDQRGEPSGGVNEGARLVVYPDLFQAFLGSGDDHAWLMPGVAAVLASRGITSIHDPATDPTELAAYRWLEREGAMTFRMRAGLYIRPQDGLAANSESQIPALIDSFTKARSDYEDSKLIRVDGVKLFVDGVLEGDPLTNPPTLPVAAVLGSFQQPMFDIDATAHRISIRGYVNRESEACRHVRQRPTDFSSASSAATFQKRHGHAPSQCQYSSGVLENSEAFIHAFVQQATAAGFNVHIHALSDKGTRVAVDALEAAKAASDQQGLTQSLAHLQLVHPDEQQRIGRLGIYSSFTYAWIVPEPNYNLTVIPFLEPVASPENMFDLSSYYMRNVYPVKAIVNAGGRVTWGSDAPVESRDPRPFINLEQAVTRALEDEVLNAANAIDIHAALAAFTINGAQQLGIGNEVGTIESGKLADLIVLDQNVVELAENGAAARISDTEVVTTIFDGKVVYEAPEN
jgi:predicted amidohydrolase YtcJ